MKVSFILPQELFNHLRLSAIHRKESVDEVIVHILTNFYRSRQKD